MSLRWKLNLSVVAFVAMTLAAGGIGLLTTSRYAGETRAFMRSRELSQFTADVRTHIFQRLAASAGLVQLPDPPLEEGWPGFVLNDVDVQIRLAHDERERSLWMNVRASLSDIAAAQLGSGGETGLQDAVVQAERSLRDLRHYFDVREAEAMVTGARLSLIGQIATGIACGLAVVLFLVQLIMMHHWLIRPVQVLKSSADVIGQGDLSHRVPLAGKDELAQLARRIDAMADGLAAHQSALMEARELSAIGELCAHVAHGLRNPLAAIRAGAQLAERRSAGADETQSMLRALADQADRMDHRITRLFQFSKPRALHIGPVSFAELARAARSHAASLLEGRGVRLSIDDGTAGAVMALDREQVSEALGELISNAAHHSDTGGEVVLTGEVLPPHNGTGPLLRVQIIDRGAGMAEATAAKAFDLFFTSRPEGTGMGLALVRRAVERHDGRISLKSKLGEGTTVTILLPTHRRG